jgi:DNA-binding IclR family transcriptional regulator
MATATKILSMVRTVIATRTILDGRFVSGRVSLAEVVDASGCPRRPVLRVLDRLAREGWLELVEDVRLRPAPGECGPKRRNPAYLVHRDIRLHRAAQDRSRVTCRDKVWSTLRAVRRTTVGNLMRLTGCGEGMCREYLSALLRGHYVRRAGLDGRETLWVLVKDAGPRRPETSEPNAEGDV